MHRQRVPTLGRCQGEERERRIVHASARDLAAAIPGAEARVVAGVFHLWNLLAPEQFTQVVRAFVRDEPLPDGLLPLRRDRRHA